VRSGESYFSAESLCSVRKEHSLTGNHAACRPTAAALINQACPECLAKLHSIVCGGSNSSELPLSQLRGHDRCAACRLHNSNATTGRKSRHLDATRVQHDTCTSALQSQRVAQTWCCRIKAVNCFKPGCRWSPHHHTARLPIAGCMPSRDQMCGGPLPEPQRNKDRTRAFGGKFF
jgi:hypothetical protein